MRPTHEGRRRTHDESDDEFRFERVKPQTQTDTLVNILEMVISAVLAVYYAWYIQGTCNNKWSISILKTIGILCLSGLTFGVITGPMMYWDYHAQERARHAGTPFNGTIPGKIAAFMTGNHVGWAIIALTSFVVFTLFTKGCKI